MKGVFDLQIQCIKENHTFDYLIQFGFPNTKKKMYLQCMLACDFIIYIVQCSSFTVTFVNIFLTTHLRDFPHDVT